MTDKNTYCRTVNSGTKCNLRQHSQSKIETL